MFDSKVSTAALIQFTRVSSAVCLSSEVVKGLRVDDCDVYLAMYCCWKLGLNLAHY